MRLFRPSNLEQLPVSIAGIKLGDRVLMLGSADPKLIAQLALKTGLTGRFVVVDEAESRAARAAEVVEREGALIETVTAPWTMLPLDAESFDVAVVRDVWPALDAPVRSSAVREVLRVLRPGGRCLVMETAARSGFASLLSRRPADPDYAAVRALSEAGFKAVRTIAERDGVLFAEGVKENR